MGRQRQAGRSKVPQHGLLRSSKKCSSSRLPTSALDVALVQLGVRLRHGLVQLHLDQLLPTVAQQLADAGVGVNDLQAVRSAGQAKGQEDPV